MRPLWFFQLYIYIYMLRGKKDATTFSRQACESWRVKLFTKQACQENVVASSFPLKIFIPLCFNVLSTVPRENRLANSLYIYIYPCISNKFQRSYEIFFSHANFFRIQIYFVFFRLSLCIYCLVTRICGTKVADEKYVSVFGQQNAIHCINFPLILM